MDINELIAIIKKKLQDQINIQSMELKKINRIESTKKIYKILDKELKEFIHSIQVLIN
jgi:BolA protein